LKCSIDKCKDYWMRFEKELWLKKLLLEKKAAEKASGSKT
jgi:hypothetical protein